MISLNAQNPQSAKENAHIIFLLSIQINITRFALTNHNDAHIYTYLKDTVYNAI